MKTNSGIWKRMMAWLTAGMMLLALWPAALAVSAASALSLFTGDFDPADYERLHPQVSIHRVL